MGIDVRLVHGRERVELLTRVVQRARLADPVGGVWEAADLQWWWRTHRPTDDLPTPMWVDESGPCAALSVLDCLGRSHAARAGGNDAESQWQVDLFAVPGFDVRLLWAALADMRARHRPALLEIAAPDENSQLVDLLADGGFVPIGDAEPVLWMDAADRPPVLDPPPGFRIVDRASRPAGKHPMGDGTEERLRECSLYDANLDLAALAPDGEVAGYGLFWADPVTGVGMLEPMRVHDAYQRRGLAGALLANGLDRLARTGIRRIKVTFSRYAGHELHERGVFRTTGMVRMWKST